MILYFSVQQCSKPNKLYLPKRKLNNRHFPSNFPAQFYLDSALTTLVTVFDILYNLGKKNSP